MLEDLRMQGGSFALILTSVNVMDVSKLYSNGKNLLQHRETPQICVI